MKDFWKYLYKLVLSVIIIFSVIIIISSLNIFGRQIFVVMSGSMEPKIRTGSIVLDKKQVDYSVEDVITYRVANSKDTVTHRIIEIKKVGEAIAYQTKGDANDAPDRELVPIDNVVGKVYLSIPFLGYFVAFLKTLPGLIIFIVIPATIIVYQELTNIKSEVQKLQQAKKAVVETVKKVEKEIITEEKKIVKKVTGKKPVKKSNDA
jgi:signal peptidase